MGAELAGTYLVHRAPFSRHVRTTWLALQMLIAGYHPRVPDAIGLGWGPIICISNQFPGKGMGLGQKTTTL